MGKVLEIRFLVPIECMEYSMNLGGNTDVIFALSNRLRAFLGFILEVITLEEEEENEKNQWK